MGKTKNKKKPQAVQMNLQEFCSQVPQGPIKAANQADDVLAEYEKRQLEKEVIEKSKQPQKVENTFQAAFSEQEKPKGEATSIETFQKKLEETKEKLTSKEKGKIKEPAKDDGFTVVQEKARKKQDQESDEEEDMTEGKRAHLHLQQFMEQKRNKTYKSTVKQIKTPAQKKQEARKPMAQPMFAPAPATVGQKPGVFDPYALFNAMNQGGGIQAAPTFIPGQAARKPAPLGVPSMPKPAAGPVLQPATAPMPKPQAAPAPFIPSAQVPSFVPTAQPFQPFQADLHAAPPGLDQPNQQYEDEYGDEYGNEENQQNFPAMPDENDEKIQAAMAQFRAMGFDESAVYGAIKQYQEEEKDREEMERAIEQFEAETEEEYDTINTFLEQQSNQKTACKYYAAGSCQNGNSCQFSHNVELIQQIGGKEQKRDKKGKIIGDHECAICLEMVKEKGEIFGLLENCDHIFCLSCIRDWRSTLDKKTAKSHYRTCPICRANSFLVVPSDLHYKAGANKEEIFEDYKFYLGDIPCKIFNFGSGECPFRNSCFYAHRLKDGTPFEYGWMENFMDGEGQFHKEQEYTLASQIGSAL